MPVVKFPRSRTRFTTEETLGLLGIPTGSKPLFFRLLAEAGIKSPAEVIGNSRTYSKDQVLRLAEELTRQRKVGTSLPARPPQVRMPRGKPVA